MLDSWEGRGEVKSPSGDRALKKMMLTRHGEVPIAYILLWYNSLSEHSYVSPTEQTK